MTKTFIAQELGVYTKELGMGIEPMRFLFCKRELSVRENTPLFSFVFSIFFISP
jgi:hypothetical protein